MVNEKANYSDLREWLSEQEHDQWMYWSKALAHRMKSWSKLTFEDNNNFSFESNELTINVIGITYGSTTIFWGNETITFND